jgi:hypothetical protein
VQGRRLACKISLSWRLALRIATLTIERNLDAATPRYDDNRQDLAGRVAASLANVL